MLEKYSTLLLVGLFVGVALVGHKTSEVLIESPQDKPSPAASPNHRQAEKAESLTGKWLNRLSKKPKTHQEGPQFSPIPDGSDGAPINIEMVVSSWAKSLVLPTTDSPHSVVPESRRYHLTLNLRVPKSVIRQAVAVDQWEELNSLDPIPKRVSLVPKATPLGSQFRFIVFASENVRANKDGSTTLTGTGVQLEILGFEVRGISPTALPPESYSMAVEVVCVLPAAARDLIPDNAPYALLDLIGEYRETNFYQFDYMAQSIAVHRQPPPPPPTTKKENKDMAFHGQSTSGSREM